MSLSKEQKAATPLSNARTFGGLCPLGDPVGPDEGDRFLTVAPTFLQPSEAPGAACGPGQQHREPAMARRTRRIDDLFGPVCRLVPQPEAGHIANVGRDPRSQVRLFIVSRPTER